MLKIKREGVLLRPTKNEFENKSVFNPGVFQDGETVHIFYRAINQKHRSCLGYARLNGPLEIVERWQKPFMRPRYAYEKMGIEDPRVVKIKGVFYMTYVVHDGKNALIAYSYGKNLFKLKRGGIISPQLSYQRVGRLFNFSRLKDDYYTFKSFYTDYVSRCVKVWDKDGYFFPEKIKGGFAFVHRILPDTQIAYAKDVKEFKNNSYWAGNIKNLSKHVILEPAFGWETRHVGGGAPPIKTNRGWLMIYHGVEPKNKGRIYHAGAALLDLKNPTKVLARLPYPLLSPSKKYEKHGHVDDVVFPTGTSRFKDRLYIYYGTADSCIAAASVNIKDLLAELSRHKTPFNRR